MSDKKVEKTIKALNELPVDSIITWSVNTSVVAKTIQAQKIEIHTPELTKDVGTELVWSLDPQPDDGGWVFGSSNKTLTIYLPSIRKLVTKDNKLEIVKTVETSSYDVVASGPNVWTIEEISSALASWTYDLVNRSDLIFEYTGK